MIAIPSFMKVQIEQYNFLSSMLNDFDKYSDGWLKANIEKEEQMAKKAAEGNKEIEASIIKPILDCLYDTSKTEKFLFYQAMLLMAYAYYLTNLDKMGNDSGVAGRPSCICKAYRKMLSKENEKKSEFLNN